jgi:branched-chain amino acid transport system ATP-binding protein
LAADPLLEVDGVHAFYGRSHVLQGVDLAVMQGEIVALLGRNGAGKTTTLRSIVSLMRNRRGRILLDGVDVTRRRPSAIARAGVAFVPSGRRVFGSLSVRKNLLLGERSGVGGERVWTVDRVFALFPKLAELTERRAGFLSGGEQQMLKLGRALLGNPSLLLLDEPTEGLAPAVVHQLREWLGVLRDEGLSILLAEQNMAFALALADRGYVLEKGRIQEGGTAAALSSSPEIRRHLAV